MDIYHEMVGYAAACCTTFAFVPQAIKCLRTRDTEAISLSMYSIFTLGVGLWLAYGILLDNYVIITANVITGLFAATILSLKIRNDVFKKEELASRVHLTTNRIDNDT